MADKQYVLVSQANNVIENIAVVSDDFYPTFEAIHNSEYDIVELTQDIVDTRWFDIGEEWILSSNTIQPHEPLGSTWTRNANNVWNEVLSFPTEADTGIAENNIAWRVEWSEANTCWVTHPTGESA